MLPFSSGTGVVFTFAFPGTFSTGADAESRKNFTPAADKAAKIITTPMLKHSFVFQLRMYSRQNHFISASLMAFAGMLPAVRLQLSARVALAAPALAGTDDALSHEGT